MLQAIVALALLSQIVGCATAIVGSTESSAPPRLVPAKDRGVLGETLLTWDRPFAFGPVSEDRRAAGDTACLMARVDLEALGYHSGALDENGNPMVGGGFYCAVKLNGDAPDIRPPRLIKTPDGLRWDRPKAFGRIPEKLKKKAVDTCDGVAPSFVAYGFHPWARGLDGKGIEGGGFFCGPPKK